VSKEELSVKASAVFMIQSLLIYYIYYYIAGIKFKNIYVETVEFLIFDKIFISI